MAFRGRPDRGWTLHASLILLILFWGLAFVAIKQALVFMSWITLTLLRFAVADALFVGYLVATRQVRHPPAREDLPMLVLLAFFGFTGYHLFLNLGETDPNVSAGTAALIIASAPAFIAIFAIPLLKERIGRWQSAGIALAFAGLAVIIFFVRPESQFTFRASEGALTVVPPAIFSALYAVLGKSLPPAVPSLHVRRVRNLVPRAGANPRRVGGGLHLREHARRCHRRDRDPRGIPDGRRDRGRSDGHRRRGARAAAPDTLDVTGAGLSGFVRAGTSRSSAPCS